MAKKPTKKVAKKATKKTMWSKKAPTPKAIVKEQPKIQKWSMAARPRNTNTLSYTQAEFLENIKGFCGLLKRSQAKELAEDIARFVKDSLRRGYKLPLLGLGKLYVRQTKARTGRNPATGDLIQIPAKRRVRFVAAKALKEAVL